MACRQHLVLPLALGWVYGVRSIFGLCLDHSGVNSASNNLPLSIFIGAAGWFTTEPAAPRSEGTETSFMCFSKAEAHVNSGAAASPADCHVLFCAAFVADHSARAQIAALIFLIWRVGWHQELVFPFRKQKKRPFSIADTPE